MDSGFWYEAGSLIPSIGVGLLFWFVMRAILRADRREREAERVAEAELRRDEVASRRADARRRAAGDSHSETAEEVRSDGR